MPNNYDWVRKTWMWIAVSIILSTVVATLAVQKFLDEKINEKITHHVNTGHEIDNRFKGIEIIKDSIHKEMVDEVDCICPEDKVVISGGVEVNHAGNNVVITKNGPKYDRYGKPIGWELKVVRNESTDRSRYKLIAYAICANVVAE